jgi:hypothetical protein
MIRREIVESDSRKCWLLISQIEHARIAGELAAAWRGPLLEPAAAHDELLAAIAHHDDGWAAWERRPGVDPQTGRPRDFTEMVLADSLAIWEQSIAGAEHIGPMAAWAVSRHFCVLLEHSLVDKEPHPGSDAWRGQDFLRTQSLRQRLWRQRITDRYPTSDPGLLSDRGRTWLQRFDWISLWLCCSRAPAPLSLEFPYGPRRRCSVRGFDVTVEPWPFAADRLELQAPAREVAAGVYRTPMSLEQAESQARTLRWTLHPGDRS